MKTVAISGVTGMLGSMVYRVFRDEFRLVLIYRDRKKFDTLTKVYGGLGKNRAIGFDFAEAYEDFLRGKGGWASGTTLGSLVERIGKVDAFVNCAGVINKYSNKNPALTFFINSALPQLLSQIHKDKLLQVTTDCVYDGLRGAPYDEFSSKTACDLYGLSKSLGEPARDSLVLRTSLVGPEIADFVSLLEWFRRNKNKEVFGYTNHFWNGVTTRELARIMKRIISKRNKFPKTGLFHIFSNRLSKYEMLVRFKSKYKVRTRIIPNATKPAVDRSLTSIYDLNQRLRISSFDKMLEEL